MEKIRNCEINQRTLSTKKVGNIFPVGIQDQQSGHVII